MDPSAGGANISLSAVFDKLVNKAAFTELDRDVAATWKTILNGHANWLANEIPLILNQPPEGKEKLQRSVGSLSTSGPFCVSFVTAQFAAASSLKGPV